MKSQILARTALNLGYYPIQGGYIGGYVGSGVWGSGLGVKTPSSGLFRGVSGSFMRGVKGDACVLPAFSNSWIIDIIYLYSP